MTPDLVLLECHQDDYGQKGALSHILFPTSIASVPQCEPELCAALVLSVLELEAA